MTKPNQFFKRAGRVIAGVNVLFNLGTAPKPPDLQVPARTQDLQVQWAKNEKANVLPSWRNRARELGYQLREPVSGEHRPREGSGGHQPTTARVSEGTHQAKDVHDQELSQRPSRASQRRQAARSEPGRGTAGGSRSSGTSRRGEGQSR